jgi:hypothetical protein
MRMRRAGPDWQDFGSVLPRMENINIFQNQLQNIKLGWRRLNSMKHPKAYVQIQIS